jgi:hypothetical protein
VIADEDLLPEEVRRAIEAGAPAGRAGWVMQQFLSMFHLLTRARHTTLVWDADTLMLRPHSLLRGTVATLSLASRRNRPYFDLIRRLFPTLSLPEHTSTTSHHMIVVPELLREMFSEIERHSGYAWWQTILDRLDRQEPACLSDYEMYGQWLRERHPERVRVVGFRNLALPRNKLSPAHLERLARRKVDSVSLHWWVRRTFAA